MKKNSLGVIFKNYFFKEKFISPLLKFSAIYIFLFEFNIFSNINDFFNVNYEIIIIEEILIKMTYSVVAALIVNFFINYFPEQKKNRLFLKNDKKILNFIKFKILNIITNVLLVLEIKQGQDFKLTDKKQLETKFIEIFKMLNKRDEDIKSNIFFDEFEENNKFKVLDVIRNYREHQKYMNVKIPKPIIANNKNTNSIEIYFKSYKDVSERNKWLKDELKSIKKFIKVITENPNVDPSLINILLKIKHSYLFTEFLTFLKNQDLQFMEFYHIVDYGDLTNVIDPFINLDNYIRRKTVFYSLRNIDIYFFLDGEYNKLESF